jgi:hypothetical protein
MQRIFDAGVTAREYQRQGKAFEFPDLSGDICPQCESGSLRKHGFYTRYLILILSGFEGFILIRRYLCVACGRTVSLLPSFAHPGRTYGVMSIIGALCGYYVEYKRVTDCVRSIAKEGAADCSRQLLLHFRKRFEANLPALIMWTVALFPHRGPPEAGGDNRKRGKQYLECVRRLNPEDVSKKVFEHSRTTYLSPLPSR